MRRQTMLRPACVLMLVALAGSASATGFELTVGPADAEHYYLRVRAAPPEAPREAAPEDDCAHEQRPESAGAAAGAAIEHHLSQPVPFTENGSTEPYVPRCLAAPLDACEVAVCVASPARGYIAYDVSTGRYYVELSTPAGFRDHGGLALTGTTGGSAEGDCKTCPPPLV